jgi:hypothetical protein
VAAEAEEQCARHEGALTVRSKLNGFRGGIVRTRDESSDPLPYATE